MASKGDYTKEPIEFIFNRDIMINEKEAIEGCISSVGIISNKTVVSNHPYVTDVDEELKQIEDDRKAAEKIAKVAIVGDGNAV